MPTLAETIRAFAQERVLGEHAATFVASAVRGDAVRFAEGERLFTVAQAAFNGLIAQVGLELIESRNPCDSEAFRRALEDAVQKRKALLAFVSANMPRQDHRNEIRARLDAERWRPFAIVAYGG